MNRIDRNAFENSFKLRDTRQNREISNFRFVSNELVNKISRSKTQLH